MKLMFYSFLENSLSARPEIIAMLVSEIDSSSSAFTSLINNYIGIDISTLKLKQPIQLEGILVVSSVSFSQQDITGMKIHRLASWCGEIKQGLTAIVSINLSSNSKTLFQIYWGNTIKTRLCARGISSVTPISFITSFHPSQLPSFQSLFFVLRNVGITIPRPTSLRYLVSEKNVVFDFHVHQKLTLIPKLTQVCLTNFQVKVPVQNISFPSVTALVDWNLGSFRWSGVSFTIKDSILQVKWTGQTLNIGDFVSNLGLSFRRNSFLSQLKDAHFLNFDIKNPSVSLTYSNYPATFSLHVRGSATINGWRVKTESLVQQVRSNYTLALGIVVKNVSVANLLRTLFGIKLSNSTTFLQNRSTIGMVVSSVALSNLTFDNKVLSKVHTTSGLSLIVLLKLPSSRGINLLCKLAKLAPTSELILTSDVSSINNLVLSAHIGDIPFGLELNRSEYRKSQTALHKRLEMLTVSQIYPSSTSLIKRSDLRESRVRRSLSSLLLKQSFLNFRLGSRQHNVDVSAELDLNVMGEKLQFRGTVRQAGIRLELEMRMIKWWKKAFYLPFLSLGNGLLAFDFYPSSTITTLQLKADIKIGNIGNGRKIQATVDMRLDFANPSKNYFYGHISKFTLGVLLNAFDVNVRLPRIISDMGFSRGMQISYTSSLYQIRSSSNNIIPPGCSFSGSLNFLGLRMFSKIAIQPLSYFVEGCLDSKIEIPFGLVAIYKSSSNRYSGPCLKASIDFTRGLDIDVSLEGYISLLGGLITTEIKLIITESKIEAKFSANLFLFNLNIVLKGSYGNLLSTRLQMAAHVTIDILRRIGRAVTGLLRSAADKATSVVDGLQRKLDDAKAYLDKVNNFLSARQRDVDYARRKLEGPKRALQRAKQKVDSLCRIRSCSLCKS